MIETINKDLIGKWLVYYISCGTPVFYGEIIDVDEKRKEMLAIGENGDKRWLNDCHVKLFETTAKAKEEWENYKKSRK